MFVGFLAIVALWALRRQLVPLITLSRVVAPLRIRLAVALAGVGAGAVVHGTMTELSSWDVQSSSLYTGYYDLLGAAWLGGAVLVMHHLGLSLRDDVLERRNPAALIAFVGVLLGHALAYAGGNIGDGPGWWCVVVASGLAGASLLGVWLALHLAARVPDAITVERDAATGLRVGALLAGAGLIAGRAAAGTWVSLEDTVATFVTAAWPLVPIVAVAAVAERLLHPSRRVAGSLPISLALGLAYVAASVVAVQMQGAPL